MDYFFRDSTLSAPREPNGSKNPVAKIGYLQGALLVASDNSSKSKGKKLGITILKL